MSETYTINEAAALTARHPNTIRQRIRLGQLEASVQHGKFGEEYRIEHAALVRAGLLPGEAGPAARAPESHPAPDDDAAPLWEAIPVEPPPARSPAAGGAGADPGPAEVPAAEVPAAAFAALSELYQRHEQAMFRLGFVQGELDRAKALADTAESLRADRDQREGELRTARAEQERRDTEAAGLRAELGRAREQLRELEALRRDLETLKQLAAAQEQQIAELEAERGRSRWPFWRR